MRGIGRERLDLVLERQGCDEIAVVRVVESTSDDELGDFRSDRHLLEVVAIELLHGLRQRHPIKNNFAVAPSRGVAQLFGADRLDLQPVYVIDMADLALLSGNQEIREEW